MIIMIEVKIIIIEIRIIETTSNNTWRIFTIFKKYFAGWLSQGNTGDVTKVWSHRKASIWSLLKTSMPDDS